MSQSSSPWEQDLATLHARCIDGMADGDNHFELVIIPYTGKTDADLPDGFADVVRKFCELPQSAAIIPARLHFLPYFRSRKSSPPVGKLPAFHGILGAYSDEVQANYLVSASIEGLEQQFAVLLRTDSISNYGELLAGELTYRKFMRVAGTLLRLHQPARKANSEAAWISFLVEYLWNHDRSKISHQFATVTDLWVVSLSALKAASNDGTAIDSDTHPAVPPKRRRGPKRVPFTDREKRLIGMYEKGWGTHFKTFNELAEAAGDKWNATTTQQLIRRMKKQRDRDRKA